MASLILHQDKVLQQLNDLKTKIVSMQNELGVSSNPSTPVKKETDGTAKPKRKNSEKEIPVSHQQQLHREQIGIAEKPINVIYTLCV